MESRIDPADDEIVAAPGQQQGIVESGGVEKWHRRHLSFLSNQRSYLAAEGRVRAPRPPNPPVPRGNAPREGDRFVPAAR